MKIVVLLISLFVSSISFAKECQFAQGAVDFGSGTTKFYAALVDVCEKKFIKTLYEDRLALALNEAMEKTADQTIPSEVIDQALPKIKAKLEILKSHKVKSIVAVATSVFRVAGNGAAVAQRFSTELDLNVRVISQQEEAELGYWSAKAQRQGVVENLIVWDIGGGSMQMYTKLKKRTEIYEGQMASVTFKNKVLEILQFKDPKKEGVTPNPLFTQVQGALQISKNHAYTNVPPYFKKNAKHAHWVGVGGVLSLSVQRQVNEVMKEALTGFTAEQLLTTLQAQSKLSDKQIKSEYRLTDVTNLALVLGHMQALGIPKVETVQASLGQGLLFKNLH